MDYNPKPDDWKPRYRPLGLYRSIGVLCLLIFSVWGLWRVIQIGDNLAQQVVKLAGRH